MMYAVCDGCGKKEPAGSNGRDWFKPSLWFERTPKGATRPTQACSRECIEKVEREREASGEEYMPVVAPF